MKKGLYSKIIVVFCVLEMTFMQAWAMRIASRTGLMVTGILTINHGVFGGELLMLCLKRMFSGSKNNKE